MRTFSGQSKVCLSNLILLSISKKCVKRDRFCSFFYPITSRQNFRLVQIETNCRRRFKVHLKWKKVPYSIENIVRKGGLPCYKQFLLFSQWFPQLHIFRASKCRICVLMG